ncbi:MAG TPA: hypothetical protein VJN90_02500 [Candidatus Acidoferrales bacterium]|nr:hypothetical protein [Candidatus Acidoferrales bacterium]
MCYFRRVFFSVVIALATLAIPASICPETASAQQINPNFYNAMRWREIGPYRAGRVTAVAGVPGNAAVYYIGTPGGGVWKTTDGGAVWNPIFDAAHVASIGAVTLAPSDTNIVYVGTGEQTRGNGVYKSTDAGATWTNIGLADTHFINSVLVDPRNPNIIIVGAMGDGTASENRGVYKSTDGGKTWKKTLYKDDTTGIADMTADPDNPRVIYAALWKAAGRVFFPPAGRPAPGPDAWIYKSTDEGSTWKMLNANGMSSEKWGRTGVAVAPGDHGRRVFAITNEGLYRSDDAGANWRQITDDPRVVGNGYFSRVFVDPKNADLVYVMQTCTYRSTDGGVHFDAFKGAPDGDDYHVLWIDPTNSNRMLLGVDQGAIISLDAGKSWTPWYNQPTGQLYHLSADNQFPYVIYASQQDSGTVAIPSRSDFGRIRDRDVFSPAGYEFGYIVGDPLHPYLVYSDGAPGTVVRLDRRTNQIVAVFDRGTKYRSSSNAPLLFSPQDPQTLYYGSQYVLETTDGGMNWREASPDLTQRPKEESKETSKEPPVNPRSQVITALAASPVSANVMWAGTGDGLIQLTRDGGATWQNVSMPGLDARTTVSIIDASHFEAGTAYAAVDKFHDSHANFYRTHDYGKTWQPISAGFPDYGVARVIREDTARKGLLYAGTENGVFVSSDDGDTWQSLQLNLPSCDVRDLIVHGDDLAIATYGRSLWILDDVTPLRQAGEQTTSADAFLYRPETAIRVRWNNDQDTPLPPEVPAGQNPPDGAFIDYYLKSAPQGDVTLTVSDSQGNLIRKYSSAEPAPTKLKPAPVPEYWFAPPTVLPKNAGMNRFVWNLRYPHPANLSYALFNEREKSVAFYGTEDAVPGVTPRFQPLGPQVVPGDYELALTVNGQTYRQTLHVVKDPRVQISQYDYVAQLDLLRQITAGMSVSYDAFEALTPVRHALDDRLKSFKANAQAKDDVKVLEDYSKKFGAIENGTFASPGFGGINSSLTQVLYAADTGDGQPSESVRASVDEACQAIRKDIDAWRKFNTDDVPALNALLKKYKLAELPAAELNAPASVCGH